MTYIIIVLIAYLLGSFCASIPLSKRVYGGDVREKGSGNAGATNMARVYGMKAGIATFMLDAVKTAAAMLIGVAIGGEAGKALAGAACIVGHCWPVYFSFRGGKGVSVGAALGLMTGLPVFAGGSSVQPRMSVCTPLSKSSRTAFSKPDVSKSSLPALTPL